ncbi:hypothetical protein FOA52_004652 [Chlamydomonas sp. UWO 241]|nr:hypothetical protein FOA52_004652 [Chlamydomonas sp. UWO 241]
MWAKLKGALGRDVEEEVEAGPPATQTLLGSLSLRMDEATTLTWTQRVTGFAACIGVGILLSTLSLFCLQLLAMKAFAILYSLGAIVSILSTGFLVGFSQQLKWMTQENRLTATLIYVAAIFLTLFVAFYTGKAGPSLLCVVVQFLALCWYCITWIPGAQGLIKAWVFRVTNEEGG